MTYTPPTAPASYEKITAPGLVQVKADVVHIRVFEPEKEVKTFHVDRSKCPPYVKSSRSGDDLWMIDIAANGSRLNSQRPMEGIFDVRTKEFAHRQNAEPQIKIHPTYGSKSFTVILEILSGYEKGMTIPFILPFFFAPVEEEVKGQKYLVVGYEPHPKSAKTPLLQEWAKYVGLFDRGPIKWSDNPLPVMAKRVADNNKGFRVVIKDGWVNSLMSFTSKSSPKYPDDGDYSDYKDDDRDFEPDVEK